VDRDKAGDFSFIETPEGNPQHGLVRYDVQQKPMKVFFVVSGPLMWLDEGGRDDRDIMMVLITFAAGACTL